MFGPQFLNPGFYNGFQHGRDKADKFAGFSPALNPRFSNSGNHLGHADKPANDSPAQAGKVMLARLVTSVESGFSATQIHQFSPLNDAEAATSQDDFSPDAVSERILGFVQQRLEQEKANGASEERLQELYDQATAGIEKGFAEARKIIGDHGLFSDEVKDNFLETVSKTQQGLDELGEDLFGSEAPVPNVTASREESLASTSTSLASNEVYYNQKRSFDMQVKTQDGDVVTIKVKNAESFSASSFQAATDNVSVSGFESNYSNSSRFEFSVEGDLDEGELAALNDLFSQVNDIADDFYAGDVEEAFNQAMDVGYDASELAGFAVNMRRSEVVAVRQTYAEVSGYGEPAPAIENPLQGVMDKLADFSAKVQQAHSALLDGTKGFDPEDSLLSQLMKELVPDQEQLEQESLNQGLLPHKQAFDQFIDSMLA